MSNRSKYPSILRQLDQTIRRNCQFIGRKVEKLDRVTRVTGPAASGIDNVIMWSDLNPENALAEIDSQIAYYKKLGHAFEWIAYEYDSPPELESLLLSRGFQPESQEEVMVKRASEVPHFFAPSAIELRRASDSSSVADIMIVSESVWGGQHREFLTRWLTDLITNHSEDVVIVTAYDGEKPVGAAWALTRKNRPFAPLFGGSVISSHRKRGIYRAMVSYRARSIAERGIEFCLVDAREDSFPILQKLGFERLTGRKTFFMPCCESGD